MQLGRLASLVQFLRDNFERLLRETIDEGKDVIPVELKFKDTRLRLIVIGRVLRVRVVIEEASNILSGTL